MKLANFLRASEETPTFGVLLNVAGKNYLLDVAKATSLLLPASTTPPRFEVGPYEPATSWEVRKQLLQLLIGLTNDALATKATLDRWLKDGVIVEEGSVTFLSPVLKPANIIAIGSNYFSQINEKKTKPELTGVTKEEFSFPNASSRLGSSLTGHDQPIPYPPRTKQFDYEGELAIVIGKKCRDVTAANALDVIAGFSVSNDISLRDLMKIEGKRGTSFFGKSADSTMPVGPYLVTLDEIKNPDDLAIRTWVNGVLRQDDRTSKVKYSLGQIIEFFSQGTLSPGDLIFSGTPSGSGINQAVPDDFLLKVGDVVEVEIEDVGRLRNTIVLSELSKE